MRLNGYCIFDEKAQVFQRPFFVGQDGEAVRLFCDLVKEVEHPVGKHPEDYLLRRVGHFDDLTAVFSSDISEVLVTGLDAISLSERNDVVRPSRFEDEFPNVPSTSDGSTGLDGKGMTMEGLREQFSKTVR